MLEGPVMLVGPALSGRPVFLLAGPVKLEGLVLLAGQVFPGRPSLEAGPGFVGKPVQAQDICQ